MDFGAMFQTWIKVLTNPGEATFEEERSKPNANLTTALLWIVLAAFILAIFSAIRVFISGFINVGQLLQSQSDLPPEVAGIIAATGGGSIFAAFCIALIAAPIGFLIGSGIYFLIAKLFGGTGSFEEQSYLLATFTAPIMIVNGAVSIIPILGGCVSLLVSIYQLVLTYFAIKVSHGLDSGRAVAVILIPVVIGFICAICVVGAIIYAILSFGLLAQ